jgi:predicted O-methyltransferase YrrM
MAFIDGDKRTYTDAYEMALTVVRPGGFILADNTLWDGHVSDPAYDHDQQTVGIRHFNDLVANDPRVEAVILPMRDGLTIVRVRNDFEK